MREDKDIYALGIGHNTPVMIDIALDCGYNVVGLYHYKEGRTGENDHGYKVLGTFEDLFKQDLTGKNFLLTMGDNNIRAEILKKILELGGKVPTLIHPRAYISRYADISPIGVVVEQFAQVGADAQVGANSVIGIRAIVGHTSIIGENSFIAAGSTIGAYTKIGDFVFVGLGAIIIPGSVKNVGNRAFIGAGVVIRKEVPDEAIMVVNSSARNVNPKAK